MKSRQYLEEIRRSHGLVRAVLKKIVVEGDTAVFHLATDVNYSQEDVSYANEVSARYAPAGMKGAAKVVKSAPSEEGVRRAVAEILKRRFPAFSAFIAPEEIGVSLNEGGGRFVLVADNAEGADEAIDAVSEELARSFCGRWLGELRVREQAQPREIERQEAEPAEPVRAPRTFPVADFSAIDGNGQTRAVYLADLDKEAQGVTVCGTLSHIEERVTKNGKPYFTLTVSDGTGSIRASYFSKKATVEKVRSLSAGAGVCLTGDSEFYNGALTFRVRAFNLGALPADFVPEARPSRPVPAHYTAVFPTPESDLIQGDLFGESSLPDALLREDFVVFDLETTGLGTTAAGMDHIIEIGAVKIRGGKICEKFSTFVASPVRLSEEIVALTGITDEMLVGAPPVSAVIADFYKFTAGCSLVGHNAQGFDIKFIRHYGEKEGYLFEQKVYDTLLMAQSMLRLPNHKLNTIADHFGFTFRHHRAYDDAFVTAKIFIELVRQAGGLPR